MYQTDRVSDQELSEAAIAEALVHVTVDESINGEENYTVKKKIQIPHIFVILV